jgi:2-iminobutanoate/2-iminopropanoate deaminase
MKREVIYPWPLQPEHNTPYVPAIKVDGGTMLFMSGMGATKPNHKHPHVPEEWNLPDDAAEQTRRVLDKIKRIVETAGGSFEHIVKITRFMKNIADQDRVNEVIHEYFGSTLPCSTTVQVSAFVVPTMLIEIDAWAVIPTPKPAARTPSRRAAAKKNKAASATVARGATAGKAKGSTKRRSR